MKQTPQIRLVFTLTRRDRADFDRDAVTRGLGILPTRSCPPTPGKGKVQHCGRDMPYLFVKSSVALNLS